MLVAIVSDIHGNRHAFEAVLADAEDAGADEMWCLGDLVGYGAEPDACVELARRHAAICLAGNHDLGVTGEIGLDEFSTGAAIAARWTQETISDANLEFLSALRPEGEEGAIGLYHASPRDPVWEYVLSISQAGECLDVQQQRVCLIGHSHVACHFSRNGGDVQGEQARDGTTLELAQGEWLVNPGSVGQPRDGDPRASYALYDSEANAITLHRVEYDIAATQKAMTEEGLPLWLIQRLETGR
jgi:predicted phosphodiesterase